MNGHIIPNTPIAVDIWRRDFKYIHFLSHCHTDHTVGLTSTWRQPIYTSHFNAWMMEYKFKIKSDLLKPLSTGDSHIIQIPVTGEEFTVTLIDAKHCAGSVMFLFQGSFGTILYTGDFRYDPVMLENSVLAHVVEHELLDVLYVDNTYASSMFKIPSREEATKEILDLIRGHPDDGIILGLRTLGKEEILRAIALDNKEKIYVSRDRMAVVRRLKYEDVFSNDPTSCRIHVVDSNLVNVAYMQNRQKEYPHIAILPTALYMCGGAVENRPYKNSAVHGIHVIPYSDHSSYEELFTFISRLKPTKLCPVVNTRRQDPRRELSYWELIRTMSIIPASLYGLCKKENKNLICEQKKEGQFTSQSEKEMPCTSTVKHIWRPGILRKTSLPLRCKKKGVHFESCDSSDSDVTSVSDEDTTDSEREDIVVWMPHNKYIRVRAPIDVKSRLRDVHIVLFDISNYWRGVTDILRHLSLNDRQNIERLSARMKHTDLRASCSSDRTPDHKNDAPSDSDHGDVSLQEMSLPSSPYIKDIIIKSEITEDCDYLSSIIPTANERTQIGGNSSKDMDISSMKTESGNTAAQDRFSLKEELYKPNDVSDTDNEDATTEELLPIKTNEVSTSSDSDVYLKGLAESYGCLYKPLYMQGKKNNKNMRNHSCGDWTPNTSKTKPSVNLCTQNFPRRKLFARNTSSTKQIEKNNHHKQNGTNSNTEDSISPKSHEKQDRITYSNCKNKSFHKSPTIVSVVSLKATGSANFCEANKASSRDKLSSQSDSSSTPLNKTIDKGSEVTLNSSIHCKKIKHFIKENIITSEHTQCCKNKKSAASCEDTKYYKICVNVDKDNGSTSDSVSTSSKERESDDAHDVESGIISDISTHYQNELDHCNSSIIDTLCSHERSLAEWSKNERHNTECVMQNDSQISFHTCVTQQPEAAAESESILNSQENVEVNKKPWDVENTRINFNSKESDSELQFFSAKECLELGNKELQNGKQISNGEANKTRQDGTEFVCFSEHSESEPQFFSASDGFTSDSENGELCVVNRKKVSMGSQNENFPHSSQPSAYQKVTIQYGKDGQCEISHDLSSNSTVTENCAINKFSWAQSQNPVRIMNLLGEMEVFSTEEVGINNTQCNENKHTPSPTMAQPSKLSNLATKNNRNSKINIGTNNTDEPINSGKSNVLNTKPGNTFLKTVDQEVQTNFATETVTASQRTTKSVQTSVPTRDKSTTTGTQSAVERNGHSSQHNRHLTTEPTLKRSGYNFWTGGKTTPFAMVEVYLAAQKIPSASQSGEIISITSSAYPFRKPHLSSTPKSKEKCSVQSALHETNFPSLNRKLSTDEISMLTGQTPTSNSSAVTVPNDSMKTGRVLPQETKVQNRCTFHSVKELPRKSKETISRYEKTKRNQAKEVSKTKEGFRKVTFLVSQRVEGNIGDTNGNHTVTHEIVEDVEEVGLLNEQESCIVEFSAGSSKMRNTGGKSPVTDVTSDNHAELQNINSESQETIKYYTKNALKQKSISLDVTEIVTKGKRYPNKRHHEHPNAQNSKSKKREQVHPKDIRRSEDNNESSLSSSQTIKITNSIKKLRIVPAVDLTCDEDVLRTSGETVSQNSTSHANRNEICNRNTTDNEVTMSTECVVNSTSTGTQEPVDRHTVTLKTLTCSDDLPGVRVLKDLNCSTDDSSYQSFQLNSSTSSTEHCKDKKDAKETGQIEQLAGSNFSEIQQRKTDTSKEILHNTEYESNTDVPHNKQAMTPDIHELSSCKGTSSSTHDSHEETDSNDCRSIEITSPSKMSSKQNKVHRNSLRCVKESSNKRTWCRKRFQKQSLATKQPTDISVSPSDANVKKSCNVRSDRLKSKLPDIPLNESNDSDICQIAGNETSSSKTPGESNLGLAKAIYQQSSKKKRKKKRRSVDVTRKKIKLADGNVRKQFISNNSNTSSDGRCREMKSSSVQNESDTSLQNFPQSSKSKKRKKNNTGLRRKKL